ncbi:MAG TPA: LamG-like jellyroll fold domain-containing protein [Thermoanaerobaculia bacterium]|nr:LamG-like jellyroll fold domain-containing protein [Thermoanaerobaculia bacterium]
MAKHFDIDTAGTLETGLVAGWNFEGNSNDEVGSRNGSDTSITYSSGNGKILQGAGFGGSSRIDFSSITWGSAGSISFFFNTSSLSNTQIMDGDSANAGPNVQIFNSKLYFGTNDANFCNDAANLSTGVSYHVIITWDGIALKLYKNLVNVATGGTSVPSTSGLKIGQDHGNANGASMSFDLCYYWSKVLSSQERTDLNNGGAGNAYRDQVTTYTQSIPATATASVLLSKVMTAVRSLTQTATSVLSLTKARITLATLSVTTTAVLALSKVRTVVNSFAITATAVLSLTRSQITVKALSLTATVVPTLTKAAIHLVSLAVGGTVSLSDGPLSPATTSDDATVGTVAWTNPNNAQTDNGSYATAVLASVAGVSNESSHYLKATNFGFAIPTSATITGVVVEEKVVATNTSIRNANTKLVKGGAFVGTAKTTSTVWSIAEAYISFGGSSDLWGTTWTPAEVNSSGFGVGVSAWNANSLTSSHTASLNHIRITVHYTTVNGVASVTLSKQLVKVVPLSLVATAVVALSKVMTAVRSLAPTVAASIILARTVMFTLRITALSVLGFVRTMFQTFGVTATAVIPAFVRTMLLTLSVTTSAVASLVKGLVSVRDLAVTATASISLSKISTFLITLSVTSLAVLDLAKGFLYTKTLAVTATAITDLSRVATHVRSLTVTALGRVRVLLDGLQSFFSRKYPSNPGSYSDKYPSKPGSYTEKYPSNPGNYEQKYPS